MFGKLVIFKPSAKKIVFTLLLFIVAVFVLFLLARIVTECIFNWGCTTVSFYKLFIGLIAIVLIYPPILFANVVGTIFFKDIQIMHQTSIEWSIIALFSIFYLYVLVCLAISFWQTCNEWKK